MNSVGVVVPAYHPTLSRLTTYLEAIEETLDPAVIRVELDDPRQEALTALADCPVDIEVATSTERRGKGVAITAGFESLASRVDVLAFADADGSTPAESLAAVVAPVADGDVELSVGSRRHPDAEIRSHQTFARRRLGDGFAWFARRFLDVPLYDYQCGAKALSVDTWLRVREHLYEPGFAWDIELIAVAGAFDCRVREVPVVWEDYPESTVSTVSTTFRLARALVRSRQRARSIRANRPRATRQSRDGGPSLVERLRTDAVDE